MNTRGRGKSRRRLISKAGLDSSNDQEALYFSNDSKKTSKKIATR